MFVFFGLGWSFKDQLSDKAIVSGAIVLGLSSIPLFIFLIRKVFFFKAKNNQPIDEDALIKKISNLTFKGTKLTLTQDDAYFTLSPPNMDETFISVLRSRNIRRTYEMKLWFDDETHLVRFKEKVSRTAAVFNMRSVYFKYQYNSGLVLFNIKQLNDEGELISFSNKELHEALIKVVTENGWNLGLKII